MRCIYFVPILQQNSVKFLIHTLRYRDTICFTKPETGAVTSNRRIPSVELGKGDPELYFNRSARITYKVSNDLN
jgi:hypothetical protein